MAGPGFSGLECGDIQRHSQLFDARMIVLTLYHPLLDVCRFDCTEYDRCQQRLWVGILLPHQLVQHNGFDPQVVFRRQLLGHHQVKSGLSFA